MEVFERLDTLEKRVIALLQEIDRLREENRELKANEMGLAELRAENDSLKEDLVKEQQMKHDIDARIDSLLTRIREYTDDEKEA